FEDAVRTEAIREALNSYGIQNLARYAEYLENVTRNAPASFNDRLATRGATWAFLRYAADHSGMPDDVFFRGLVNTRKTGFDNLAAALDVPPLERMRQWGVSIYTDDLVETGDSLLQQPSWDFRSLLPALPFVGRFPLDVEQLPPNGEVDLSLQATTSGYVRVEAADKTVRLRATSGGASPPSQLQ